jgi:LemA protein
MSTLVTVLVALAVLAVPLLFVAGIYNGLVQLRNRYRNAFAQIDVQLKRRYDLIPNLVEAVRAFMQHERETLEAVIQARNAASAARESAVAGDAASMQRLAAADSGLGGVLGRLFAVSEAYPELRSNQNMMNLQEELTSTESKVAFARQAYNDSVMAYNNKIEMFPSNLVAGLFNFAAATPFEITNEAERDTVRVQF